MEFAKAAPTEQEIEFEVTNIEPGSRVTFVIDGRDIATVVADKDGVAEFEGGHQDERRSRQRGTASPWTSGCSGSSRQPATSGVAALMFIENVIPAIPSELILPFAGYLTARGELNLAA